jgi:phage replication O-like protein O
MGLSSTVSAEKTGGKVRGQVSMPVFDRFVRVPTELLDALLKTGLSGAQWRIILWVVRNTYGWNRKSTPFTWYRVAQELDASRPGLYRAGQGLLAAGVLLAQEGQITVQPDSRCWNHDLLSPTSVAWRQLRIPGMDVAARQRLPLPGDNANVAGGQRKRCLEATLFRRTKDSKDRLKTYIKTGRTDHHRQQPHSPVRREQGALAGAAQPVPGKYDRLSQN